MLLLAVALLISIPPPPDLMWPVHNPAETNICFDVHSYDTGVDGNGDGETDYNHYSTWGYNCNNDDPEEYQVCERWQWTNVTSNGVRFSYHVLDHVSVDDVTFRPIAKWYTWDPQNPTFKMTLQSSPGDVAFHLNQNGNVVIGDDQGAHYDLNVMGLGRLLLAGTSGGTLTFEGPTVDGIRTSVIAANPQQQNVITLPDATGKLLLTVNSPTAGSLRWGDGILDDTDTAQEVCNLAGVGCWSASVPGDPSVFGCLDVHSSRFFAWCE